MESQNCDEEDEHEHFVVEAAPLLTEIAEIETVLAAELEDDEKHGRLVKKILETKKDYEKLQQDPRTGEKAEDLKFWVKN
ncbi:TRAF3-interacting protein 1-like [Fukomys damarensis]|uniref:TRAF3-interacting protein 1-like n=1 Tax=Fukomys damarensis TaxID=885580 RepID=UPI00145519E0|nr:TRAF3-interacting protein 1-like [Fukomys damarensis]